MEGLDDMLKNLPKLLREREAALEERERELECLRARLEQEYPNQGCPSDVIRLNIGGAVRVDVLRRTLTQFKGSLLESKFSGRWDDSLEKDADGSFFIDQPERWFVPLIDYLRSKQCETPLSVVTDPPGFDKKVDQVGFKRMVEYYGMTLAVYPIGIFRLDGKILPDGSGSWDWDHVGEGTCKLKSNDWATFCLKPSTQHKRFVKNYEVTLEQSAVAQIGWINLNSLSAYLTSETARGVGYGENSLSLDCTKSSIASSGAVTSVDAVTVNDGFTIRSEDGGRKWFLNGTIVAQSCKKEDEGVFIEPNSSASFTWVPCISIKGRCEVSFLELSN